MSASPSPLVFLSIHPSISRACPLTSQIQVVEPIIIEDEVVVQNLYTSIPEVKVVVEGVGAAANPSLSWPSQNAQKPSMYMVTLYMKCTR